MSRQSRWRDAQKAQIKWDVVQTAFAKTEMQRGFAKVKDRRTPRFDAHRKSVCLDVLNLYRQKLIDAGSRKKVGWSTIRDEIMFIYDERKAKKIIRRDERLVRQDLEAWSKTGSTGQGISDAKFAFIHDFVIDLSLSGKHPDIEDFIIRRQAEAHCRSIATMYQSHKFDKATADHLAARFGQFLLSDDLSARFEGIPFRHVAMRFDFVEDGAIKITLAYLACHPSSATPADVQRSIFCDGYLVPHRIPYDGVMVNLRASKWEGNPLAFTGELAFADSGVVRVECGLIVLGQLGVGSASGRTSGEAMAYVDVAKRGIEHSRLNVGLAFPVLAPSATAHEDKNDNNATYPMVWGKVINYQMMIENYSELSGKVMNIDFSVINEYRDALEAVFDSGHRGLLI